MKVCNFLLFKAILVLVPMAILCYSCKKGTDGVTVVKGIRDPWVWPFSQSSIWNHPIGSGAIYKPVNFSAAANVGVDIQHILKLKASDPLRVVLSSPGFGPGRCSGTDLLGFSLPVPDDWTVPDAGNSPYGATPNSNFAFLLPNSDTVFEGSQVSRCVAAGPIYMPDWMKYPNNQKYQNIKGEGLTGGGPASGMSALGGTIRLGELVSDMPIRHAIKINPWAKKYCYYSASIPGFKWPANSADSYASVGYGGTNPLVVMGSLFAIPSGFTAASLKLTTVAGEKLFFTLQNYGVYFTDDAAWDDWDLVVERNVEVEFLTKYGFSMYSDIWKAEINKLMAALYVVVNNSANNIGGGGNPLQPLAPAFSN